MKGLNHNKIPSPLDQISNSLLENLSWKIMLESKKNVEHTLWKSSESIKVPWDDTKWFEYVKEQLNNPEISESQKAYFSRIMRVHAMNNLTSIPWHPINLLIESILGSEFYQSFDSVEVPEVVSEFETFDLFNFPTDHVARRPSDSYFISKSPNTPESILLRPHTSVMWYHYLVKWWWIEKLTQNGEVKALSWGKVYRVDELDKTHHECFHQIDGFTIARKDKEVITQETLKNVLANTIHALFWDSIEYRFNEDSFPYTTDSLEVEVLYGGKRLEVTWAWVVHPTVLEKLWLDSEVYNGWAFWFGIERLVMALKQIPDIRIFWSEDQRITKQWGNFEPYKEVSSFPPVFKDISMKVPKTKFMKDEQEQAKSWEFELTKNTESDFFAVTGVIRDVWGDLIEEVKITDMYENDKKFWSEYKSLTMRIVFRSIERTLTNDEINKMYFEIRNKLQTNLGYELR